MARQAHSSCTARRASGFGAVMARHASSKRRDRALSWPNTAGGGGGASALLGKAEGRVRSRDPGSQILGNTTTSAPGASRVVLPRLFMGSTSRLGFWRGIVVLPRFPGVRWRPDPSPLAAKHRADHLAKAACADRRRAESRKPGSDRHRHRPRHRPATAPRLSPPPKTPASAPFRPCCTGACAPCIPTKSSR